MLDKIREYVRQWHMVKEGDKIIAGISGGADSICLLFVLMELQKEIPFEVIVVHVNHGIRGADADADEAYVKQICEKHQIACVSYLENIELISKKRKQSMEEAGREVRREAFYRTMKSYGGTKIALAHHKNDNAETFIMNLARGTGLKGLGGIQPVRDNIIRPLLCVERKEIEQYLETKRIAYCTDRTNESDSYTRNRIRNHVIPYLENEINAKTVSHINETSAYLREIQCYMEEQADYYRKQCIREMDGKYTVLEKEYRNVPKVIRPLVFREILKCVSGKEKDIEAVHLNILQELMRKQVGRKADLPYGIEAERIYQGIVIQRKQEKRPVEQEEFVLSFRSALSQTAYFGDKRVSCRILDREQLEGHQEKNYTKWFDYDIIKDTVSIRTRKPGDYIAIHKDGRVQKLKAFFINEKVPQKQRGEILLVAKGAQILWIVGYRVNPVYQISEYTKKVLEIQINEGEDYGGDN